MNSKQSTVLIFATVLFLMSVLTQPWLYEDTKYHARRSAGYHLFTGEPKVKSDAEMQEIFSYSKNETLNAYNVRKNTVRLHCEWIAILLLAVGGILITRDRITPLIFLPAIFLISLGCVCAFVVLISS